VKNLSKLFVISCIPILLLFTCLENHDGTYLVTRKRVTTVVEGDSIAYIYELIVLQPIYYNRIKDRLRYKEYTIQVEAEIFKACEEGTIIQIRDNYIIIRAISEDCDVEL